MTPEQALQQLEAMAKASQEAEGFLGSLSAALFPDGLPGLDKVTWNERAKKESAPQSAEDRLRAAEVRFRTLVEQIPAVTFLAVLGDGKNEIYVSPHIEQLLGFTQQEWLEAPFLWYWQLHPDDRQVWNDEFTRGCQTGGPFKAECRFIARDGRTVWVHGEARLVKDETGRPMLLQGIAYDITEAKKAQDVLLKEATRTAKQQQEVAIAHRVQTSILPATLNVPGLEMSAAMIPAEDVGGDYYDVQPFDGGAWLAIGDVSGHGLDSGLVMMMLQSALAAVVRTKPDITPREALLHANALMFDNVRTRLKHDDHVTLTLMRFLADGRIVFAGAHEDIIVCRASGKVDLIRTPGTWLGGMENVTHAMVDTQLKLEPNDVMVLYTDGVTEAMNASGELFELERLTAVVQMSSSQSAEQIRDAVLKSVRSWMAVQNDDITVLVARYVGSPAQAQAGAAATAGTGPVTHNANTRSLLEGTQTTPVPELTHDGPPNRLSALARHGETTMGLKLLGSAESPDVPVLESLFLALHKAALAKSSQTVEVDLRALKFMSSSCFKQLVTWLTRAAADKRYRVLFVIDPQVRWQRTGVAALSAFSPDLMEAR